jgi:hypothetical protein
LYLKWRSINELNYMSSYKAVSLIVRTERARAAPDNLLNAQSKNTQRPELTVTRKVTPEVATEVTPDCRRLRDPIAHGAWGRETWSLAMKQLNTKQPTWNDVKAKLADFDRAGLIGLIQDLYAASTTKFAIAATAITERNSPKSASDRLSRASSSNVYPSGFSSCLELL